MDIQELVEDFLAYGEPTKKDLLKYFTMASNIGFGEAVKQCHTLAKNCIVPDSYSQPTIDDLALDIVLLLNRNV